MSSAKSEMALKKTMKTNSYRDLIVWQKSFDLAKRIYKFSEGFPKNEIYGLTQQIRRAAVSIPSNIAEGYGRQHRPEYRQSLAIAYGSLCELETQYSLAIDLNFVSIDHDIDGLIKEVGKMLYRMLNPKQ